MNNPPNPVSADTLEAAVERTRRLIIRLYDTDAEWELFSGARQNAADLKTLLSALQAQQADAVRMREALERVHSWLVCAPVATNADMAQGFPLMEGIVAAALNPES